MRRRIPARKSLRELYTASQAGMDWYAALSDKPKVSVAVIPPEKIRRHRSERSSDAVPLESEVLKLCLKYLKLHPKVASVERSQSGVFREGDRFVRVGFKGKLDIQGVLRRGARAFEIEVKRPGGKLTTQQMDRIEWLRGAGVLTGCVHSVDELHKLMETA